jgi:hypothetical protein
MSEEPASASIDSRAARVAGLRGPSGSPPVGDDAPEPRVGTILDVLAHRRRRLALYYLNENGGRGTISELVDYAAESALEEPHDSLGHRIRSSLAHVHLPKLADVAFVDYSTEHDSLSLGAGAGRATPYLAVTAQSEARLLP